MTVCAGVAIGSKHAITKRSICVLKTVAVGLVAIAVGHLLICLGRLDFGP